MANGLRKIIKKARREYNKTAILARRRNRFGSRLGVEELEERIAPAVLGAGQYIPYDTVAGVGVLYNAGAVAVGVTMTDGGAANVLDTFVIDCDVAGAVSLVATDELSGTGGILFTDSAAVTLTLSTGIAIADINALWAGGVAHLDGVDPGADAAVAATGGDVVGSITLNSVTSSITAISVVDGGTGTGKLDGAVTVAGDVGTITVAGSVGAGGDVWTVGDQLTGAWTVGNGLAAAITAANGGTSSADIAITAGGLTGSITATLVGMAGDIDVTAGGISGNLTATAGGWSGDITVTAGGITGGALLATAGGWSGDITVTAGNFSSTTTATAGGWSGDITVVANDLSGARLVTAGGLSGNTIVTAGDLSGTTTVTAGGMSGNITVTAGDLSGAIAITAGSLSGDIAATAGSIGNITLSDGSITSDSLISAGTTIGTITADDDFAGDVTAGTTIAGIVSTDGDLTSTAVITAGGTITAVTLDSNQTNATKGVFAGSVTTSSGDITAIDIGGAFTGTAQADDNIGALTLDKGLTAGTIRAVNGDITGATLITTGGLAGTLQAGNDITGTITVTAGGLSGTVLAASDITALVTVTAGGLSGSVKTTTGDISGGVTITAVGLSGTIEAVAGSIGGGAITITAGGTTAASVIKAGTNISGDIIAAAGSLLGPITATNGNISGTIQATAGAVTGVVTATTGNISGTITAGTGDVTSVVVGGNLTGIVQAEDDVTSVAVTGNITGATINADTDNDNAGNIVTVTAGGAISGIIGPDVENINTIRSGGATGDDITAIITATKDIDLIDAGAAVLGGTVTSTIASSTSATPLATFIHEGVSYAVWAFTTGSTTVVDTGVTATIAFDGDFDNDSNVVTHDAQLAITNLADSTAGAADIWIRTAVDTGLEQTVLDADSAGTNVTVTLNATAAITVGIITVEGNLLLPVDTDITYSSIVIQGGATGIITVTSGQNLTFGSIGAAGLTINPAAGVTGMGTLMITDSISGDLAINCNVAALLVGTGVIGLAGDINDDVTISGTLGQLTVSGDVNASVSAASFTTINIGGDLFNNIAGNEAITATVGNMGTVTVGETIGADTAQTATIRSTFGTIGQITAGGSIGAAGGGVGTGTTIRANGNLTGVKSLAGDIGDVFNTPVTITSDTGDIGVVTAAGAYGISATITADSDIAEVSATYDDGTPNGTEGIVAGTIRANSGNITLVSTIEADISAAITATIGNIDKVWAQDGTDDNLIPTAGAVSATITAGGDVDSVMGNTITGNTTATLGTTSSPVTTWQAGDVLYTFDATVGPIYNYNFNGGTKTIAITVDNWNNTTSVAYAVTVDVALTTTNATDITVLDDEPFGLTNLSFDSDSVTNGKNDLGTVQVEGNVRDNGIHAGNAGSLDTLIVEGDVEVPVLVDGVKFVSVGSAYGVEPANAAAMQALFVNPNGSSVTFGTPADGVYRLPVSSNNSGNSDISFSVGDGSVLSVPVLFGAAGVTYVDVTVAGGVITGYVGARSAAGGGSIIITGDLTQNIIADNLGNVTITGSIPLTLGIDAYNIGNIFIGTQWVAGGDMAGTIRSAVGRDATGTLQPGNIGTVTIYGDLSGTIYADGTIGAVQIGQRLTAANGTVTDVGSFTGNLIAGGGIGAVTAQVNVGSSDPTMPGLIMAGGSPPPLLLLPLLPPLPLDLGNVTATTGFVSADIFAGEVANNFTISGTAISGDLALGAVSGAAGLVNLNIKADANDSTPVTYIVDGGAASMIEIAAGNITATSLRVDRITVFADSVALSVRSNDNVTDITVDEIFVLENTGVDFDVTVEGHLGNLVVADGNALALTSDAIETNFIADYNLTAVPTVTFDVVDSSNMPTAMDDELNDDQNIDMATIGPLTSVLSVDSVDAVIVSGDLVFTADVPGAVGDIVSLNGNISGTVHSAVSIGNIVASVDINGTFDSEGTLAVGDATGMQTDLTGYGLNTLVPTWFYSVGGVLAEVGDVGTAAVVAPAAPARFSAAGTGTTTLDQIDHQIPVVGGDAMGMIYVMAGDATVDVNVVGDWEGMWVPVGDSTGVDFDVTGSIDTLIMPNFGIAGIAIMPNVRIQATNGETVASELSPYTYANMSVTPSAGVVAIIATDTNDTTNVGDILVLGLNAAGTSLTVNGNVDTLDIESNWVGDVDVNGVVLDETTGVINAIEVHGNIEADASLSANFDDLDVSGTIDTLVTDTGTVVGGAFEAMTTMDGGTGTLAVVGSRNVTATWNSVFNKVTDVTLTGRGSASVVFLDGDVSDRRVINRAASNPARYLTTAGGNHLGEITVDPLSSATLKTVAVDGDLDGLQTTGKITNLFVARNVLDNVEVGNAINKAFIGGNVGGAFRAMSMKNVYIGGDADVVSSWSFNNVKVMDTTNTLLIGSGQPGNGQHSIQGSVLNSYFNEITNAVNTANVRVRNSHIG